MKKLELKQEVDAKVAAAFAAAAARVKQEVDAKVAAAAAAAGGGLQNLKIAGWNRGEKDDGKVGFAGDGETYHMSKHDAAVAAAMEKVRAEGGSFLI